MFPLSASPPEVFCYLVVALLVPGLSSLSCPLRVHSMEPSPLMQSHIPTPLRKQAFFQPPVCSSAHSLLDNQTVKYLLLDFLRKEVIQPHLPIRLPCYDFTPVIRPAFDGSLLAVGSPASGIPDSHGVTGGVYKTRERIHRGILIRDY